MRIISGAAGLGSVFSLGGPIDCSANPNYPASTAGQVYEVTVPGRIGGASGPQVDAGDNIICWVSNGGGTHAAVGSNFSITEHNIVGPLLAANNLSDVANAATARANLSVDKDGLRLIIDGGGFAIAAGSYIDLPVRFAGTITGYRIGNPARQGATDAISIDVRKCTEAQYTSNPYPTASIVAAAPIALAGGAYLAADDTLTGWTTALAAGEWLRFYVSSATAIQQAVIILNIVRA